MESKQPNLERPSRWQLAGAAGFMGGLAGGFMGSLDGLHALFTSGLVFENPAGGLLKVAVFYAVIVGAIGFIGGWLRKSPPTAAGWAIGITAMVVLSRLVLMDFFGGKDLLTLAPVGAMLAVLAFSDILRRTFNRLIPEPWALRFLTGGILLSFLLAWGAAPSTADLRKIPVDAPSERPPNLVVILVDTLRADRLSCYGYDRPTSPVLDTLAAKGTRFERAWAQSPWTRPSVATLFTSLYPSTHGTWEQADQLAPSAPLLSEAFREAGYHTAGFSANVQISPTFGFSRGFDWFWNEKTPALLQSSRIGRLWKKTKQLLVATFLPRLMESMGDHGILRGTDALTVNAAVLDWVEKVPEGAPVFLYVHYLDPHQPYNPPEDLLNERDLDPLAINARLQIPWNFPPFHPDLPESRYPEPEKSLLRDLGDLYDAEIRFVDREIGILLANLRAKGVLTDQDYLLFLSDHGEEFYDHYQWRHGNSLFEEMIRVPLILVGPGVPAQVFPDPVQLADIFPTLGSLMGIRIPETTHGLDLAPMLEAGRGPSGRIIYSERPKPGAFLRAVVQGASKLVSLGELGTEMKWMAFDLENGPGESEPVAADPSNIGKLGSSLVEIGVSALASRLAGSRADLDPETLARLAALGYADPDS